MACGCTTSEGRSSQSASVTAQSSCSPPTVTSAMAGTRLPSARFHQVLYLHTRPFSEVLSPGILQRLLFCFFSDLFSSSGFPLSTWRCFIWVFSVPHYLTVPSLTQQGADAASSGSAFDPWVPARCPVCIDAQAALSLLAFLPFSLPPTNMHGMQCS